MQTTVRVLNVFLASPDDVKLERGVAEELVISLNKLLRGTFPLNIELHRWEDTPPGFGRPQEIINADADKCDIFIGLLWEKWGQPTGKYSSGFEEEYERARHRRKTTGEPEIWLVFKTVKPEKLGDPGPQLSKVLEFRRAQVTMGEALFKEVKDTDDWKAKLYEWLLIYIFKLAGPALQSSQPQLPASAPGPESLDAAPTQSVVAGAEGSKIPKQLLNLAESLTRVIKRGKLEFSRQDTNLVQEFDVARLFLLAATWMFRRYTGETLGTHEMNLLYKHRQRLEVTPTEYFQLFRAMVADASDVIPGWFWFQQVGRSETIRDWFLSLASHDSSIEVRRRALVLLRTGRIELPKELWPALPLQDDADSVRIETYKYLALVGDDSVLPSLEQAASTEHTLIASAAGEARFSLLARTRPPEAFSELMESDEYISDKRLRELEDLVAKVSDDALLRGAENHREQLRKLSVSELARRGRFSKDLAAKLTADSSVSIREIAFTELARQGQQLDLGKVRKSLSNESASDGSSKGLNSLAGLLGGRTETKGDANAVILAFYKGQSASKVLEDVDWFLPNGVLAYKSLVADHYDVVRDDVRSDLADGFERVKQRSVEVIESNFGGSDVLKDVVDKFKPLDDFIRSQFAEAALSGLLANGQPSDISFGRQYLTSKDYATKLAAVRIVRKFGTAEDVTALLQISRDDWGDVQDEAGVGALRLATDPFRVARELTQSRSTKLVHAGFEWLYGQGSPEANVFFDQLIEDASDTNRLRSVYYFSKRLKSEELAQLLEAQFDKETYYYNVVTWLDRLLYAPKPLMEFFAQKLEQQATS
jgi:hypothetical protein